MLLCALPKYLHYISRFAVLRESYIFRLHLTNILIPCCSSLSSLTLRVVSHQSNLYIRETFFAKESTLELRTSSSSVVLAIIRDITKAFDKQEQILLFLCRSDVLLFFHCFSTQGGEFFLFLDLVFRPSTVYSFSAA